MESVGANQKVSGNSCSGTAPVSIGLPGEPGVQGILDGKWTELQVQPGASFAGRDGRGKRGGDFRPDNLASNQSACCKRGAESVGGSRAISGIATEHVE